MSWWRWVDDEELDEEESLPEHDFERAAGPAWWDWVWPNDDRAAWEREVGLRKCRRCHRLNIVDPLGRCVRCRVAMGRCSWCGLDPIVYRRAQACRSCYRWLHRNAGGLEVDVVADRLLAAATRRYERRRASVTKQKKGR